MKNLVKNAANSQQFWVADGVSNTAQLYINGQVPLSVTQLAVESITQTDWQGRIALSDQPRTAIFTSSSVLNYNRPAGTTVNLTTGQPGPDGTNSATTLSVSTVGTAFRAIGMYMVPTYTVGQSTVESIWLRGHVGGEQVRIGQEFDSSTLTTVTLTTSWQRFVTAPATWAGNGSGAADIYTVADDAEVSVDFAFNEVVTASGVAITGTAPVTVTDYTVGNNGSVAFGQVPAKGATESWSGSITGYILDASATFLAQYANSPILTGLIQAFNAEIDPRGDITNFYDFVWNVQTAQGFGLDIWGKIVNIPRTIQLLPPADYLGFKEASPTSYPFGQAPFYGGAAMSTMTYSLSDPAYRVLILTKALANISSFTAPSVNALLRFLFAGRGSCYVLEQGPMEIQYVFNFELQPWESSVIQQPTLMPRPAGVKVNVLVNA